MKEILTINLLLDQKLVSIEKLVTLSNEQAEQRIALELEDIKLNQELEIITANGSIASVKPIAINTDGEEATDTKVKISTIPLGASAKNISINNFKNGFIIVADIEVLVTDPIPDIDDNVILYPKNNESIDVLKNVKNYVIKPGTEERKFRLKLIEEDEKKKLEVWLKTEKQP